MQEQTWQLHLTFLFSLNFIGHSYFCISDTSLHTIQNRMCGEVFSSMLLSIWKLSQILLFSWFQKKLEDARAQMQFASLDKELKELKRAIITSDKLAAAELSIAKNQLKALHGTVLRINQERAEVSQHW